MGRWAPDGTPVTTWTDDASAVSGSVVAVAAIDDDLVVATTGSLARIDPAGIPRWTSDLDPNLSPLAVCAGPTVGIVVAGTLSSNDGSAIAHVAAFLP